jgi:hypothetical protein
MKERSQVRLRSDGEMGKEEASGRVRVGVSVGAVMPVVLTFYCPVTKGTITWDMPHDAKTLAAHWSKVVRLPCPHCKGEHSFSFKEAYVEKRQSTPKAG